MIGIALAFEQVLAGDARLGRPGKAPVTLRPAGHRPDPGEPAGRLAAESATSVR